MQEFKLYVIELENQKLFLHLSPPIQENYLFQECQLMFDFVKKNPPLQILIIFDIKEELEINFFVKFFMQQYGIQNVRGGNYTDETLSNNTLEFLNIEINTKFSDYTKYFEVFDKILNKYKTIQKNNIEEKDYNILLNKLITYNNKKKIYYLLFKNINNKNNIKNIITNIDWLRVEVEYVFNKHKVGLLNYKLLNINKYNNTIYKEIIKNIKNITNIYFLLNNNNLQIFNKLNPYLRTKFSSIKKYEKDKLVFIKNPEFLLDIFFYHHRLFHSWDNNQCNKYSNKINDLFNELTDISYTVLNIFDELNYDITHFSNLYTEENISIKYQQELNH